MKVDKTHLGRECRQRRSLRTGLCGYSNIYKLEKTRSKRDRGVVWGVGTKPAVCGVLEAKRRFSHKPKYL